MSRNKYNQPMTSDEPEETFVVAIYTYDCEKYEYSDKLERYVNINSAPLHEQIRVVQEDISAGQYIKNKVLLERIYTLIELINPGWRLYHNVVHNKVFDLDQHYKNTKRRTTKKERTEHKQLKETPIITPVLIHSYFTRSKKGSYPEGETPF